MFGDPRLPERFWSKVQVAPTGCWLWTGSLTEGYGRFKVASNTNRGSHRVAYAALVGPIPGGRELDHLCRVTCCVNPSHLEPVSHLVNVRRGARVGLATGFGATNKAKTHCTNGHAFTEENTRRRKQRGCGGFQRECRTCERSRARQRYHAKHRIQPSSEGPQSNRETA